MTVDLMTSLLVQKSHPSGSTEPGMSVVAVLAPESPCLNADPELWFAETPHGVEEAKARCLPCPGKEQCLRGALEREEPWGVWGGELLLRGVVVPRKRPRGRPRKNPVPEQSAVA